jgi:two-component system response regulator HydG
MLPELPRILVVEDDEAIRSMLVVALRRQPLAVDAAVDGAAALVLCAQHDYAVILLDLMLPRLNGVEFLHAFHAASPNARAVVILLTAFDENTVRRLDTEHAHALVRKPFDVNLLVEMVYEVAIGHATQTAISIVPIVPSRQPAC